MSNIPGVNGLELPTRGLKSIKKLLNVFELGGTTIWPRFLSGEEKVNSLYSAKAAEADLFLLVEYLAIMVTNLFSFFPLEYEGHKYQYSRLGGVSSEQL